VLVTSATGQPGRGGWDGAAIGRLADALALLYRAGRDARQVVTDAALEELVPLVNFDGSASQVWWGVLSLAKLQAGSVERIIAVAREEYPDNERLAQAVEAQSAATREDVLPQPLAPTEPLAAEPEPPPLVDREEIVAFLRSELEQVNATRKGRALLLIGDSGVGKTRLADCAVRAARELDTLVLEAQCVGAGAEPLLPLRDALLSYRGPQTLEEILSRSSNELRDYMPFVRSFLAIDEEGTSGPRLGGSTEQGLYAGLAEVLLGLARGGSMCLIVEDLTDADQDTLYFLDYFRRKAAAHRVLTILTVKLDLVESDLRDLMDKWEKDGCLVSRVPPLEPAHAEELISVLWEGPPLSEDRIAAIVNLTGGNPFFIEQYLGLRLEDPSFDTDGDVPGGVEAVLRRRVNRLDEETRAFLDAAAIALEASDRLELIAHVAGVEQRQAVRLLLRAVEARCLTEDTKGGISFLQELLRRVVYDGTGVQARRFMHGSAAEWHEEAGLLASAAHHYERAGRTEDLVRTALQGAERAEHAGLYHTAVQLYERAQPFAALQTVGPRLAKAYLVVGEWPKAEELLERLAAEAPQVRLLRSELAFVRGDFDRARQEIELALEAPSANRLETLVRLADINLYLGDLARAAECATEARAEAGSPAAVARCTGILGATAFFAGDVDEGERRFLEAMTALTSEPGGEFDAILYTTILGNLAAVSEVRDQWEVAKRSHEEALTKRREVSDARGVLQSLHAVGRSELALGSLDVAVRTLEEARVMAADLGDRLEQGKIEHTFAEVELRRGNPAEAVSRAETALEQFRKANTAYDIVHARFSLARALATSGDQRRAVEEGAVAHLETERKGFGLLAKLFPDLASSYRHRVAAGLLAYAYGDALGLPWEGRPPAEVDPDRIRTLPATGAWPQGATSDDTAVTLLLAEELVTSGGPDGAAFLARLAERAPSIKGLGPSTTNAIEHFRRTRTAPTGNGDTNGALMRSLPIGWALALDRDEDRRAWTTQLSRATHPGPAACCAALVGAACAAWAIEGAEPALLLEVARAEAATGAERCGADGRINDMLDALALGQWEPDPEHLGLDAYETLTRVLWCILNEPSLPDALLAAVRLGGDTDTVAALVGGLLGCRQTPADVHEQLPWSSGVQAPDEAVVHRLAAGIAALRMERAGG
jgi:ADP-ribosylglycohydrolase/tetratricopeptide (TPR) repeat protein